MEKNTTKVDVFDVKTSKPQVCTFYTDELTAICPFDFGGPDFYELWIVYEAVDKTLESKSLKKYLHSFRDTGISAENLAADIYDTTSSVEGIGQCYVRLEQARRGGIEQTVEVGKYES